MMTRKNESGQALVAAALALVVLLGFAGLAIDMGVLRYEKRLQQTAADAAAIAGASNLAVASGVTAGAQAASAANGFTDSGGGQISNCSNTAAVGTICVQVNNGPAVATVNGLTIPAGPHNGDPLYVEAIVSSVQPTYFMKILGVTQETITARAVATNWSGGSQSGCLYTLGSPSSIIEGVNINGSAILNAPNCGIVDNGNFNTKGNKLIVTAGTFGEAGSTNQNGPGGTVTCTQMPGPCPTSNMPASGDPLSYLTPPCSPCAAGTAISISGNGGFTGTGVTYSNGTYTIQPGTYSGINISGTGGGNTVNFAPGTYIIDGTTGCNASCISIPGNATITGTGVTFYFTNTSTIQTNGTPSIHWTPPTSGAYAGILMYQDPNDTNVGPAPNGPTLGGDNGSNFGGVLYFPSDQLTFYGNNTSFSTGIVVSDSLALSGNPTLNLLGTAGLPPGVSILKNAVLVE